MKNRRKMRTSILKYAKGEKKLTLVGVSHIGTKRYFNKLSKICNSSEVVLYELVKRKGKEPGSKLHIAMLEIINEGRKEKLIYQFPGIKINKKWINADIEMESLQEIYKKIDKLNSDKEVENIQAKAAALRVSVKFLPIAAFIEKINPNKILVEMRNCICLHELSKQMRTHNHISIIYGEGHLRHFDKMIKAMGFHKIGKSKINTGM